MAKAAKLFGLSAITLLVACGQPQTPASPVATSADGITVSEPTSNGQVIFIQRGDPVTLDPHGSNDTISIEAQAQMFEGLTTFDADGNAIPLLAESFNTVNPYTWAFTLRQGITFHDGEAFNTAAVVTSFERILDLEFASPRRFILASIEDVIPVDDYTLHIVTSFPFAPLPFHLAHAAGYIISPAAIAREQAGGYTINEHPIGTGPFVFESREHGNELRMTANQAHWHSVPAFNELIFRVIPEGATRLAMMEGGDAHAFIAMAGDVPVIENIPGLEMFNVASSRQEYLGFNTQVPPFNDPLVRRAIGAVINREDIIYGIAEGQGVIGVGPMSPVVTLAPNPADLTPIPHDLDYARSLLAQAGFPDGFDTTIYVGEGNSLNIQTAELVQAKLAQVGINASIDMRAWAAFLQLTGDGDHTGMFLLGWTTLTGEADYAVFSVFHSESGGHSGNRTHFRDPAINALLEEARQSTDQNRRAQLYTKISQLLIDEAPMIFLFYPTFPIVTRGIDGLFVDFNGISFFRDVTLR